MLYMYATILLKHYSSSFKQRFYMYIKMQLIIKT